jgi:predicted RNA-binding protein with TRAM domain
MPKPQLITPIRNEEQSSLMNEKPREIKVSSDYLDKFTKPLWDRFECDDVKPLSAIEGFEDEYQFTLLDIKHQGVGFLHGDGSTVVTTFVIVAIPDAQAGRVVTWHPNDCQVSVDESFVYLARPQKRARPGEWQDLIQMTIKVVESLKTRDETAGQPSARTYRPMGSSVFTLGLNIVILLLFGALLIYGAGCYMLGIEDYRDSAMEVYSRSGAIFAGSKLLLAGIFCIFGAIYFYRQIVNRRRNEADVQADLKPPLRRGNRVSHTKRKS